MDNENGKTELREKCSVSGKELKEGDGKFRKPDTIYCVGCYPRRNSPDPENQIFNQ